MVNVNPFNLIGTNVIAPPAPGYNRSTRVTAPNGHYLDFASDVTWGLFADGMPWFINDGVAITGRFPAGRTHLGNNIDGYTLNPTILGTQGLDQRRVNYAAPPNINTITPRKLDVILSVESETVENGSWRKGYFKTHGQAWFTCVTRPPAPGTFSPTVHWPADDVNRLNRPMHIPDIDGMLARFPSYPASGITAPATWASFANTLDQPNAAWLNNIYNGSVFGVTDVTGYEGGFPRGFTSAGQSNYGTWIANEMCRMHFSAMLNTWSAADKRAYLVRMLQHGNQWIEPFNGLPARRVTSNGGHFMWHWAASAMWLDATNQNGRSSALFGSFPGNYEQVFRVTASHIANDFVRHNSDTKPFPWRDRLVTNASGTNLTLQEFTAANNLADAANASFRNLIINRISDGDTATVPGWDFDNYIVTVGSQASPVWAPNDLVYFTPGYTITEGQIQWTLGGPTAMNLFTPTPDANYLSLQSWAGDVMLLRSLGIVAPIFEDAALFTALCNAGNYPAPAPYAYPDMRITEGYTALNLLQTQVWDTHWAAANAVPSRPGF